MIDVGLLLTMVVAVGLPSLVARWWPLTTFDEPIGFLDVALWPSLVGLGVSRVVAVGIDGPSSLGSLSDLLIIRSGVEFWPGVAAAILVAAWSARRSGVASLDRLADLTPLALIGYAGYEVTCIVRDGCYGPQSFIGLQPPGTSTRMLPIGIMAAIAVVVGAVVLRRRLNRWSSWIVLLGGVTVVSAVRSVAAIWLPHIGAGPTRQHWSSIIVFVIAASAAGILAFVGRMRDQRTESDSSVHGDDAVSARRTHLGRSRSD